MILLGSSKTAGNQIFSVILMSVLSWDKKLKIIVHITRFKQCKICKFILFALAVGFGAACQIRITGEGLCTSLALSCGGKYCIWDCFTKLLWYLFLYLCTLLAFICCPLKNWPAAEEFSATATQTSEYVSLNLTFSCCQDLLSGYFIQFRQKNIQFSLCVYRTISHPEASLS